ncbi:MAG: site-specific integrase [Chloroflexi bacterium]|nr:site-specific integrase [Chloroflexota bacterium]
MPATKAREEQRALDDHEVTKLLAAATDTPLDAPVRVLLATGMRQGELLALRWDDVDFESGTVRVRRSARYFPGQGVKVTTPKTKNGHRPIELSATTVAVLRAHRQSQAERRLLLGPLWHDLGLVFPSGVGTLQFAHNFQRAFRRVVDGSGIDASAAVHAHSLRHTAASHWIRAGADLLSVSRRLGHRSVSFTMNTYGHLIHGMQDRAKGAMDHLLA